MNSTEFPEGRHSATWSVQNWTTWLHTRDILNGIELERSDQDTSSRSPKPFLYEKAYDSVIVASPQDLDEGFHPPLKYVRGKLNILSPVLQSSIRKHSF